MRNWWRSDRGWAPASHAWWHAMTQTTTGELLPLLVIAFAIGVLPFVAMVVTSYAKIVVVLGLLRNALGVQQVPPNMVLNGVAILVSLYVMAPVGMQAMQSMQGQTIAGQPTQALIQVFSAAREPFRTFLQK